MRSVSKSRRFVSSVCLIVCLLAPAALADDSGLINPPGSHSVISRVMHALAHAFEWVRK